MILILGSDKTLTVLAKHIRQELMPTQDDDDDAHHSSRALAALTLGVVEAAIKSVATRTNYGLDESGNSGVKVPASICVWRWEVKEQHRDWLPKNAREKAETRLAERIQVSHTSLAFTMHALTWMSGQKRSYSLVRVSSSRRTGYPDWL